mgnify:CR=1 FL=1
MDRLISRERNQLSAQFCENDIGSRALGTSISSRSSAVTNQCRHARQHPLRTVLFLFFLSLFFRSRGYYICCRGKKVVATFKGGDSRRNDEAI